MEYNKEVLQCNTFTRKAFYNTFLREKIELFANDLLRKVLSVVFSLAFMDNIVGQIRAFFGGNPAYHIILNNLFLQILLSVALNILVIFILYLCLYWVFTLINMIIRRFCSRKYYKKGIDEYARLLTDDFNKNIHPNLMNFIKNIDCCYKPNKEHIDKYDTIDAKLFVNIVFNQISVCVTSLNEIIPTKSDGETFANDANKRILKELNKVLLFELICCVVTSLEQMGFDKKNKDTKRIVSEKERLYDLFVLFQNRLSSQL